MKITIETDDISATVDDKSALTVEDAFQLWKQALLAVGYMEASIDNYLADI